MMILVLSMTFITLFRACHHMYTPNARDSSRQSVVLATTVSTHCDIEY